MVNIKFSDFFSQVFAAKNILDTRMVFSDNKFEIGHLFILETVRMANGQIEITNRTFSLLPINFNLFLVLLF